MLRDDVSPPVTGDAPPRSFAITVTAAFALTGAALELLVLAARRFVQDRMIDAGWDWLWMTPASWLLAFLPVAIVLALLPRVAPKLGTARVQVTVPAFLAAFGVLFLFYPTIHWIAVGVLSAGIAAQTGRSFASRTDAVARATRRATIAGLAAAAAAAAVLYGGRAIGESSARSALPAAPERAPNVLLLVLDTVRASSLGLYGHPRDTSPRIDAFAKRGVTFRRAYSTAPWTLTTHASLFTGRYAHELDTSSDKPLDGRHPTLAETLAARGYDTAGFVANILYCSRPMGLARGFAHYEDEPIEIGTLLTASSPGRIVVSNPTLRNLVGYHEIPGRKTARDVNDAFLGWLGDGRGRPFFAFLNYYDAHEPYLPEAPWDTRFGPNPAHDRDMIRQISAHRAERGEKADMTEAERRGEEQAYDSSIAWMDSEIGNLLDELARRGVLDDTVVVLTSDHGELFGEHDLFTHANCLYVPLLNVPLVVSARGLPAGKSVDLPVSLRDVPATILDLVGASPAALPGVSLAALATGAAEAPAPSPILAEVLPSRYQPEHYPSSRGTMHSIVEGDLEYIRNGDGSAELYDLASDPAQAKNLAAEPAYAERLAAMRAKLDALIPPPPAADGGARGPR